MFTCYTYFGTSLIWCLFTAIRFILQWIAIHFKEGERSVNLCPLEKVDYGANALSKVGISIANCAFIINSYIIYFYNS